MKPIDGGRMDELPWIIPTGSHRRADDVGQVPDAEHIACGVDLQIDALSLVDGIDVENHSFPARIDIMVKAGDPNPTVISHGSRHAIELSAQKRAAGGKVKCIVEIGRASCRERV